MSARSQQTQRRERKRQSLLNDMVEIANCRTAPTVEFRLSQLAEALIFLLEGK